MKIFISSTVKDLQAHRHAVIDILRKAGEYPVEMGDFGSQGTDATESGLKELSGSDLFIGIYAHRYGYRPEENKSVTETEFDTAKALGIPQLIFMVDETYNEPNSPLFQFRDDVESDINQLLENFKHRLRNTHVVASFTTPDNLAAQVLSSISKLKTHNTTTNTTETNLSVQNTGNIVMGHMEDARLPGDPTLTPKPPKPPKITDKE